MNEGGRLGKVLLVAADPTSIDVPQGSYLVANKHRFLHFFAKINPAYVEIDCRMESHSSSGIAGKKEYRCETCSTRPLMHRSQSQTGWHSALRAKKA